MNTQMQEAFKAAGVKPKSLAERVWLYVKDHPEASSRELESVYGTSAAKALSDMFGRNMLARKQIKTRDRSGRERYVWVYKVNTDKYEPTPRPPKPKDVSVEALNVPPPVIEAGPIQPAPKQVDFASYVDGLTVADARRLYLHLKQLFT